MQKALLSQTQNPLRKEEEQMKLIGTAIVMMLAVVIALGVYTHEQAAELRANEARRSEQPVVVSILEKPEFKKDRLAKVQEYEGVFSYSNETIKLDSALTLKVLTDSGQVMGLSIKDGGTSTKEALWMLIKDNWQSCRLQFPTGNLQIREGFNQVLRQETWVTPETQTATKLAHRVKVLLDKQQD